MNNGDIFQGCKFENNIYGIAIGELPNSDGAGMYFKEINRYVIMNINQIRKIME